MIVKLDSKNPDISIIQKAGEIIRKGGLVAFPTETVYGLGANALDRKAVRKIFEVKGRHFDNPLIVHISDLEDLSKLAKDIPSEAIVLVKKFWPGPLTLILKKTKVVPNATTANLDTVAIRMPKDKIALELIRASGVPIAAPSANLSGRPSPTTAQHVLEDFDDKIDLILDGGPTKIGLESTVLDLTTTSPLILRPGGLSLEKIRSVLKNVELHPSLLGEKFAGEVRSPGMKYRHYAPRARLILVRRGMDRMIEKFKGEGKRVGILITSENKGKFKDADVTLVVGSKNNLEQIARNLFRVLRQFDLLNVDVILSETFPKKGLGLAIMNRLKKASSKEEA